MGTWTYSYDNLNRLVTGVPAAGNSSNGGQSLCWSLDPFGNRTAQDSPCPTLPTLPTATASYNGNNQVTWTSVNAAGNNFTYDAAGNVVNDNVNTYVYDGEGRICAVKSEPVQGTYTLTGYFYDADGIRVAKGSLSQLSCNFSTNGFTTNNSYVLGLKDEQVTEFNTNGSTWHHTNVFSSIGLLATYGPTYNSSAPTGTYFDLNDWLGTKRAEVGAGPSGYGCLSTFTGLPYGDGLISSGNCPDATEHHFTQKERDNESGNDYFFARYYTSALGRFTSPDWSAKVVPVPYAVMADPQSLNLYAYVRNNPITAVDLDGHAGCDGWACAEFVNSDGQKRLDELAQQNAQKDAQAKAQQQTVTIKPVEYDVINGGVSIELAATVTNSEYTDFNWIQTVTTDHPARSSNSAGVPFIDKAPWEVDDFYITKGEKSSYQEEAKKQNATVVFEDQPSAVTTAGKPVKNSFHAELSLVGIRHDGTYQEIGHVTWGYKTTRKGVTTKEPLTGVQQ
jgi:RHS repeat-associated protein